MENEVWKDINGWEGLYQISNTGMVKSLGRSWAGIAGGKNKMIHTRKPKMLKSGVDNRGYPQVILRDKSKSKKKATKVHMLVWDHFGNKKRVGRKFNIDHKDNNKLNNHIDNLQVLPNRDNIIKSGLLLKGRLTGAFIRRNRKTNAIAGYYSNIRVNSKYVYLGCFYTEVEAHQAYLSARVKYNV